MSGSAAFEWSTPADAQTKPWRVSAITSAAARADDPRRLAEDHLELRAGRSPGPASSRARSDGSTSVERDDPALGLRDGLLRDDDDVAVARASAAPAISAPRSSPSPISGRPSTGRISITRAGRR